MWAEANYTGNIFSQQHYITQYLWTGVSSLTEEDLANHSSLTNIEKAVVNGSKFSFQRISSSLVKSALEKLNIKNASCFDHITPKMLRLGSNGIADSITKLYNESIQSGHFNQDILILMYKVKNSLAPESICEIFY